MTENREQDGMPAGRPERVVGFDASAAFCRAAAGGNCWRWR